MTAPIPTTSARPRRPALGHRPALDGLRGVAVVLVLVGHLGFSRVAPAATVGVSLFLVLSGFLITMLLVEEHEATGTVRLGRFWWRRSLRLLPALLALVAVVGAIGAVTGDGPALGYTVLYAANLAVMRGVDLGVLGHTWSLALEEQFYVVWPLVLLVAWRRPRWAIGAVAVGILASLAVTAHLLGQGDVRGPSGDALWARITFGPDTRGLALLVGCLAALALPALRHRRRVPFALLPPTIVLVAAALVDQRTPGFALVALPVASLAAGELVLGAFAGRGGGARLLAWRPLRDLGRISYGLYLWHIPVFVALGPVLADAPSGVRAAVRVAASVVVAVLSRHLVELPFLRLRDRSPVATGATHAWPAPARLVAGACATVLVVALGLAVVRGDVLPMDPEQVVTASP